MSSEMRKENMWNKKDINFTDNARTVLKRRYLLKDKEGRVIETERDLFVRVARFIALADRNYGATDEQIDKTAAGFFGVMATLAFLPNSPTLMNAGREMGQLSACFVLPIEDSMEAIFETNKHAALIHKSGGGTGFSFSRIRPRNSVVASTSGVASGPVSFMKVYDTATEAVKQGGTRRGANMGVLRVDHPDIMEFISCKDDHGAITNFNISVAITDTFMEALENRARFPLINPHTGETHQVDGQEQYLDACDLFDQLVEHAWKSGEPGVIFIDRMNQLNPTYPAEQIEATNPCGEQPLPPYDSCNLGSINVSKFVKSPLPNNYSPQDAAGGINWNLLADVVRTGVHFLDNVIDQNQYPIDQIRKQTLKNRRIGLGIMGWADLLVELRLPYDSSEALALADKLMEFIQIEAKKHSSELAKVRGKFDNWSNSVYARDNVAMRNATVTTIAPTGTISIIAGCSSGIEPYYSLAYERNVLNGTRLTEVNPFFELAALDGDFYSDDLVAKVSAAGSIRDLDEVPESVRALFLTAGDIAPEDHVGMQSAFQKHCDSSVSKTVNLPESSTPAEVRKVFLSAYRLGCKGVTVYRDRSRPEQVLSPIATQPGTGAASPDTYVEPVSPAGRIVSKRPLALRGVTEKIKTGYGNLYVTVNYKDNRPFEVFAHIGKSGYTTMADTEAICRMISLTLRAGVGVAQVIRQLRGIGGSNPVFSEGAKISSIPDAIAQVLERQLTPSQQALELATSGGEEVTPQPSEICPSCSSPMLFDSGCYCCRSCGYSTC